MFRAFFPVFAILDHTGMPSLGTPLRTTRKLLYLEKMMAALLLNGAQLRVALEAAVASANSPGIQNSSSVHWGLWVSCPSGVTDKAFSPSLCKRRCA